MNDWKPIDTAPKAGLILGFRLGEYMEPVYCISWVEKRDRFWQSVNGYRVKEPTHWMPIPPNPTLGTLGTLGDELERIEAKPDEV